MVIIFYWITLKINDNDEEEALTALERLVASEER
jgi:hypothetical protein